MFHLYHTLSIQIEAQQLQSYFQPFLYSTALIILCLQQTQWADRRVWWRYPLRTTCWCSSHTRWRFSPYFLSSHLFCRVFCGSYWFFCCCSRRGSRELDTYLSLESSCNPSLEIYSTITRQLLMRVLFLRDLCIVRFRSVLLGVVLFYFSSLFLQL